MAGTPANSRVGLPSGWTQDATGTVVAETDAAASYTLRLIKVSGQTQPLLDIRGASDDVPPGETLFFVPQYGGVSMNGIDAAQPIFSASPVDAPTYRTPFEYLNESGEVAVGVLKGHQLVIGGATAQAADADLDPGEMAFWFDRTNGTPRLRLKGKQANGTVVTAAITLA